MSLLILRITLALLAWRQGWRVAAAFALGLPTVAAWGLGRIPDWGWFAPAWLTPEVVALGATLVSITVLGILAIASPEPRANRIRDARGIYAECPVSRRPRWFQPSAFPFVR